MPGIRPRVHPLVESFLTDEAALGGRVDEFGSPLHLLFPDVFRENVAAFRAVLEGFAIPHRICYAHKANQSPAFVVAAHDAGISIDVASPGELESALAAGFPPDRIEATGPKGEAFLRDLVRHGVVVNVDNLWELARLGAIGGGRAGVLVRVCGFDVSRFGIPFDRADEILDLAAEVDLRGFSFHLDTAEVTAKRRAVEVCLSLTEKAYARGLAPTVIDVGGGYRQAFVADDAEFEEYVAALRRGLVGQGEPMTWAGTTFGYQRDGEGVHGIPVFHKYANHRPGPEFLTDLLRADVGGRTVARLLADMMLEIWIEPGKALVDHAGLTVATVEFVKETADSSLLVSLDMSRDMVTPMDQEVVLDPLVVYRGGDADYVDRPVGVYFAGNLCLERDMVTNHKTWLPRLPRPGDLVVFVNTAGYQMDLSAAGALMRPKPRKVVVDRLDGSR